MTLTEALVKILKEKIKAEGKESVINQFGQSLPNTVKGRRLKRKMNLTIENFDSIIRQEIGQKKVLK